jgi:hypothetical protein
MQNGDDAVRRALGRLDEAAGEPWKPIKEQSHPKRIAGEVVRGERRTVNTANGPVTALVITLKAPDTVWDVWCYHTVLESQMIQAAPQPGDAIAIEYKGQRQAAGGGNQYHDYRVVLADDRAGGQIDWAGFSSPDVDDAPVGPVQPVVYQEAVPAAAPAAPPSEDDIPF